MASNTDLPQRLKKIQEQLDFTDGQMAQCLGCTRQLYQATKTGKVSVGLTILKGATKAFPELIGDAIIFLTDGADIQTKTADICTTHSQTAQNKLWGVFKRILRTLHLSNSHPDREQPTKSKSERL